MLSATSPKDAVHIRPSPGFVISEVHYGPRSYQSWHDHRETRLIVTVQGGFTESWRRLRYSCGPASALLRPAGEMHTDRYDLGGALCINVRFEENWVTGPQEYGMPSGTNGSTEMRPLADRLVRELRAGDYASPIGIQCGVLEILSRFSRPQTHGRERHAPAWIEATKDLLRSRLNAPPDAFEAARLAGVHPAHLSRTFRQYTGMTIGAYLRRQRVEAACDRLSQPRHSLAEIALETGFYDQAHFSRVFRRHTGVSPKEFRSLHRSG